MCRRPAPLCIGHTRCARRQRLREQGAKESTAATQLDLDTAWAAAGPDERWALYERHGIDYWRADMEGIVRQLRTAAIWRVHTGASARPLAT